MAKKKVEKPKREITRRQRSHWQQQKKRQRRMLIAGIAVIAAVGGILGGGWYINEYQPLRQTVIRVNDTEFSMRYYIDMLELQYIYGGSSDVVTFIEQSELIRQGVEAENLGITVSDNEIDEELKGYDPPLGREYRDVARTSILTEKLLSEHFEREVSLSTEQRQVMAMFLESEEQVAEVRARLENGEDFGRLAGELSLEVFSKNDNGDLGWHPRGILSELLATSVPEDYAFASEVGVLSEPLQDEAITKGVGYWVIEMLERDEEKVHTRAILLSSEQEARGIIARLEGGEDFAELAEEFSQDIGSRGEGGDMGWLESEDVAAIFKDFMLNSEPGELSQPIRDDGARTMGGYWLIKVADRDDNRKIEDGERELLKQKALSEWITSLWDNPENEVEDYLDNEKMAWAIERARRNVPR